MNAAPKGATLRTLTTIKVADCKPSPRARALDKKVVAGIAASIGEVGLLQPITVRPIATGYEVILGGHRLEAHRILGRETIAAFVEPMGDLFAELALIDENLQRADLSPAERASAVARRKAIYEEIHPRTKHGGEREPEASRQVGDLPEEPRQERFTRSTADAIGASERTVQREARRGETLGEELLRLVAHTCLDKGDELDALAELPASVREELIARAKAGERVSAKTEMRKLRRERKEAELGARQLALPTKKYGVIYCDDEWDHEVWSRETGMDRHAANHYVTAADAHTPEELHERTKDRFLCAADDCVLWMWATNQHLAIAIKLMELRGFRYVTNFAGGKDRIGLGYWNRNKHELLLIGVKGDIPCPAPGTQWDSLITTTWPREHSEKPAIFHELIEAYFATLPKIELNARRARPGWDVWGNEAPDQAADADKVISGPEEHESQAKAEEAARPDTAQAQGMLPRGEDGQSAAPAEDAASRLADGRTSATPEAAAPPASDSAPRADDGLDIPARLRRLGGRLFGKSGEAPAK